MTAAAVLPKSSLLRLLQKFAWGFILAATFCFHVQQVNAVPAILTTYLGSNPNCQGPSGLFWDSDDSLLYVACQGGWTNGVISIAQDGTVKQIVAQPDCQGASYIAKDTTTKLLYVTCSSSNTVLSIASPTTTPVITQVVTSNDNCQSASSIDVDSTNSVVYIGCPQGGTADVISYSAANGVQSVLASGSCSSWSTIFYEASSQILWVGCGSPNGIISVDSSNNQNWYPVNQNLCGYISNIIPDGSGDFYVDCAANQVAIMKFTVSTNTWTSLFPTSSCTNAVALYFDSSRGMFYIVCTADKKVKYLSATDFSIIRSVSLTSSSGSAVTADPLSGSVYVSVFDGSVIRVSPCAAAPSATGFDNSNGGVGSPCNSVGTNAPDGTTCNAACAVGYALTSGSDTRTCDGSIQQWTGMTCSKTCAAAPVSTDFSSSHFKFNPHGDSSDCVSPAADGKATCNVGCDTASGYVQNSAAGTEIMTCNADGVTWSTSLTCQLGCAIPTSGTNGIVLTGASTACSTYTSGYLPAGSSCGLACDTNYVRSSAASTLTFTCSAGGSSSTLPTCEPPCTLPTAGSGRLLTGASNPCSAKSGGILTYGSNCNVACDTANNYVLTSAASTLNLACSTGGSLSTLPTCAAPCTIPTPAAGSGVVLTGTTNSCSTKGGLIALGSTCDVACDTNYVLSIGVTTLSCTAASSGASVLTTLPICTQPYVDCTAPPAADGFKMDMTKGTCKDISPTHKLAHGDSCTFGCVTGYQMYTPVTCFNGYYTTVPQCIGYPLPGYVWFYGVKV